MKKGLVTAKLLTGENKINDEVLTISSPQVMVVGGLRHTKRATELARVLQALITVFRPQSRIDSIGFPNTWETVHNFDSVETTFKTAELQDRLNELNTDMSGRRIAGVLSNVVRKGGIVFAAVGFGLPNVVSGMTSKQSMAAAMMGFHVRFNPYPEGTWTVTLHVKHQEAGGDNHEWHDDDKVNTSIRALYEDQIPESSRDIIEKTCIPNGAEWLYNEYEGYRRWE